MIETFLKQRIRRRHAEQRRFFREIFDWTILLYLVIPVVLFIIYETIQILSGQAVWVQTVPVAWILLGWMLYGFLPAFYAWFEPADRLFFKPVPGATVRMKWYSVRYHFLRIFLLTAGLHLLCFPLHSIRFDQSSITVLLTSLALSLLQPFFSFWTYRLSGQRFLRKWSGHLVLATGRISLLLLLWLQPHPVLFVVALGVLLFGSLHVRHWSRREDGLTEDILLSMKRQSSLSTTVLELNGALPKPSHRKRPFLHLRLFKKTHQQLPLITYLRDPSKRRFLLQLFAAINYGLLVLPWIGRGLVIAFVLFVLFQERKQHHTWFRRQSFYQHISN
ncbi:MAG: ABC transporter permease [Exiguobacterium sp.]